MVAVFSKSVASNTNTEIPPGFRRGYGEHALEIAQKIISASASSVEGVLQAATWLQEMRSHHIRKEFDILCREILKWPRSEVRKYLDVARVFSGFDFSRLSKLEPLTIFRLATKKFASIVAQLHDLVEITPLAVENLKKQLLPKQPKKKQEKSTDCGDAVLEQHVDAKEGSFYYTIKSVNLPQQMGEWLKEEIKNRTFGQVLNSFREMQESIKDYIPRWQVEEALNAKDAELAKERARVAELEALVNDVVNTEVMTELKDSEVTKKPKTVIEDTPVGTVVAEEPAVLVVEEAMPKSESEPSRVECKYISWEEVALDNQCDRDILTSKVTSWSKGQGSKLADLLADFLLRDPEALSKIEWIPEDLLKASLGRVNFSFSKISTATQVSEDTQMEEFVGCTFSNVHDFGTRRETWVFALPNSDKKIPCQSREEFTIYR